MYMLPIKKKFMYMSLLCVLHFHGQRSFYHILWCWAFIDGSISAEGTQLVTSLNGLGAVYRVRYRQCVGILVIILFG